MANQVSELPGNWVHPTIVEVQLKHLDVAKKDLFLFYM